MNYLISPEAGCGHACQLSLALKKLIPLESYYFVPSGYGLDTLDRTAHIGYSMPTKGEHLIVMTGYAYDELVRMYGIHYFNKFQRVTMIIPDGKVWEKPEYYAERWKYFELFTTPCKRQYMPERAREYIQPFDMSYFHTKKDKGLVIAHSPHGSIKMGEKGTSFISETVKSLGLKLRIITGQNWFDCQREKSKAHIFIDQVGGSGYPANWKGGIGKSAYEAMLLKCCVVSIGEYEGKEIPAPPVEWVTKENFEHKLRMLTYLKKTFTDKAKEQYKWALKYCNPEFQARRIIE